MWNEVSAIALRQDIGRVCCHGLPFSVLNWEALALTDKQQSTYEYCPFDRPGFLYKEDSLSSKGLSLT
jgi:hypothetical protein